MSTPVTLQPKPSSQEPWQPLKVLIPIFDGVNTLDVNGPLDVLCNYALRADPSKPAPFEIVTTAKQTQVRAYEMITLHADISFTAAKYAIRNREFDIILIPGSGPGVVNNLVATNDEVLDVIRLFLSTPNRHEDNKWLVSICTGAILAGAAGAFKDRLATTHKAAINTLKEVCSKANAAMKVDEYNNVPHRWVIAQPMNKTKILSSGGISCGLDASLVLIEKTLGLQSAYDVASMMDYNWNVEPKPPKSLDITAAQQL